jgi:Uma2 family endonuclease
MDLAPQPQTTDPTPHRFTVADYDRMVDAGILKPGDRVELIAGQVVAMSPAGPRHASVVARIDQWLQRHLDPQRYLVWDQNPVELGEWSKPEPDLAVVRARDDFYAQAHPVADDVFVLIEVAQTSLRVDRELKARLYAEASLGEYWIVDLTRDVMVVQEDPGPEGYRRSRELGRGETFVSAALDGLCADVDALLGPGPD